MDNANIQMQIEGPAQMLIHPEHIWHALLSTGAGHNNVPPNYSFFHNQDSKTNMPSVVYCFTHVQMKDKREDEESSIELYEETELYMQHLSLVSLCFLCVNEWKSVFCCCFMMKHLRETTLTMLPTLCTAFQFQVTRPKVQQRMESMLHWLTVERVSAPTLSPLKVMSQTRLMSAASFLLSHSLLRRDYTCLSVWRWTSWMMLKPQAKLLFH